jgi:hypothetical protein
MAADDVAVTLDVEGRRQAVALADLGPGRMQVEFRELASETGSEGRELASETDQEGRELASETGSEGRELASETGSEGRELASGTSDVRWEVREPASRTSETGGTARPDGDVDGPREQEDGA